MATSIAVISQKGGTGKTTTTVNVGADLAHEYHKRVLIVDMDGQGDTTSASGASKDKGTMYDVINGDMTLTEAIQNTDLYSVLGASDNLGFLEENSNLDLSLLGKTMKEVSPKYDYILYDTPPALGNLSASAIKAADKYLITINATPFALDGLENTMQLLRSLGALKGRNKKSALLGVVLIQYDKRTVLTRQIRDYVCEWASKNKTRVFETTIPNGIAVPESQIVKQPLILYKPKSKVSKAYLSLTKEIVEVLENE